MHGTQVCRTVPGTVYDGRLTAAEICEQLGKLAPAAAAEMGEDVSTDGGGWVCGRQADAPSRTPRPVLAGAVLPSITSAWSAVVQWTPRLTQNRYTPDSENVVEVSE
jgi:hypothetical protein